MQYKKGIIDKWFGVLVFGDHDEQHSIGNKKTSIMTATRKPFIDTRQNGRVNKRSVIKKPAYLILPKGRKTRTKNLIFSESN